MEIKEFPEGWYLIEGCSHALDYENAVALIEETCDVKIQPGAILMKMTEVDGDLEETTEVTNYAIVPEAAVPAMIKRQQQKKEDRNEKLEYQN